MSYTWGEYVANWTADWHPYLSENAHEQELLELLRNDLIQVNTTQNTVQSVNHVLHLCFLSTLILIHFVLQLSNDILSCLHID